MLILGVVMVLRIISISGNTSQLEDQLDSINAENIHGVVVEVREISKKDKNPYYDVLLFMLLLQEAWYFPDESVSPLSEVIESGEQNYWDYERAREMVGPELAFAYLYAGLPAQLDEWQAQVVVQEPHKRYRVRFLQAAGKLLSDNLLAARQIVDNELLTGANTSRGKGFALLCYSMLEDFEAAQALELDDETIATFDLNQQLAYADLLLRQNDHKAAIDLYISLIKQTDFSPERHLELAVPMTALSGIDHPQVHDELMLATTSTRRKISLAGTQAMVFAKLLQVNIEGKWISELEQLTIDHPTDFWVQASHLESQLQVRKETILNLAHSPQPLISPAYPDLTELAQTGHQQQWACLLQATAAAFSYREDPVTYGDGLDISLQFLSQALGDPNTKGAIASTRIPDYEMFVLDPIINQLRRTNPAYNAGVNHAIVDYLRRVQDRYEDVIEPKQLDYRIK